MTAPDALAALLDRLPRWTLVVGKGGVGKTTCAAALALRAAARGDRTLLLSTDPARSLADALGVSSGSEPTPVPGHPGLATLQLDAAASRRAFLGRWRDTLIEIVDRGTYLDREDIAGLVDAALPGADEAMALLALGALGAGPWTRIVVDTAPTGHTLRLLSLPETFRALIALLDAMQEKHRFMVQALTHRYRADAADAFLDEMRRELDALHAALADPDRTRAVLVTRPEPVVVAETARYAAALPTLGVALGAIVVNAVGNGGEEAAAARAALADVAPDVPRYEVPLLDSPPVGIEGIEAWGRALRAALSALGHRRSASPLGTSIVPQPERRDQEPTAHSPEPPSAERRAPSTEHVVRTSALTRPLTIVGGKGGVGKTTVACALGVAVARADRPALVVSTDPAPSVADALDQPVGDRETAVAGVPGLFARQMDATAAFARLRDAWQSRIDELFDAFLGGGMDASHDRRILRDLMSLAPPGIDEMYALAELGTLLAEGRFATLIVDPAPTGHLLRLLESPALALDWAHRLMRLMLKYREVVALGDAARDLLEFARRTRGVEALLHDPERAGLLVVSLDEPLVRAETERLVREARARHVSVLGVLWNRARDGVRPLPVSPVVAQFEGAVEVPSPRGVEALRRWVATWRRLPMEQDG